MKKKRLIRFPGPLKRYKKNLMIMKCCIIFIFLFSLNLSANVYSQKNLVSLDLSDVSVEQFVKAIKQQTEQRFMYNSKLVNKAGKISVKVKDMELEEVLKMVLEKVNLEFDFYNNVILIRAREDMSAEQQKRLIKGSVKDDKGLPLPGVTVLVKGTMTGVATDIGGKFELKCDADMPVVLVFSFVGMKNKEVTVGAQQQEVNVELEPEVENLDEVVVTGYQKISKERATGSFSVVTAKDYKGKMETNIMSRIEGLVTGLVNYNKQVSIRGVSTVYGNRDPLYVVDGIPYEGKIEAINPADVENISVLKDATAASIYGARAANGVIVITTRSGKSGKTRISYDGSVKFEPLPDLDYLKLMNSSQLVDLQVEGFAYYHTPYANLNKRYSLNEVDELLYMAEQGQLSEAELQQKLEVFRNSNNKNQVKDQFLRTAITHQHNLSLTGGTEKNNYLVSLNYYGNSPYEKNRSDERIGFTLKENVKFFDWLSADFGVIGSFTKDSGKNGFDQISSSGSRGNTELSLYTGGTSYQMLRNEDGSPREWKKNKSDYELDRLESIGLQNERYIPLEEIDRQHYKDKSSYYRLQTGFNVKIMDGLAVDLRYQTESTQIKNRQLYDKDSYYVRNMVNDAATVDKKNGEVTENIPSGGQLLQIEENIYSYTMRGQVNFNRIFKEKHGVVALAGTERRLIRDTRTQVYKMGYDDHSLSYKPINPLILSPIKGTESLSGSYNWEDGSWNNFSQDEDRYVSFYGNASYTYNNRYSVTGSIRMDQSNLFGTDPKYQYRPLWSVGASWFMASEEFMSDVKWINRLNLRLTYGINGNVSKESGPYLTVRDGGYSSWTGDFSAYIENPPNPQLRWEKTAVTNLGMDFSFFNSRLNGTVDYYIRKSTDLLGNRETDPTLGWNSLLLNYGSLSNRGIEVSLSSKNITKPNFEWGTNLNFSYNKNKITKMTSSGTTVFSYVKGLVHTEGRPMYSLFSYKYAGLDPENGAPLVYDKDGNKVSNVGSIEELEYSGTTRPPYSASLVNRLQYKGLSLSFMFIYNGGHVLRDEVSPYLSGGSAANISKKAVNHWRKPGDENIKGVAPAMNRSASYTSMQVWYAANKHVIKGDYIKLRDVTLSYDLPKEWLKKTYLSDVSMNFQISNLWRWAANDSDLDPEAYTTMGYGWGARTLPVPTTYTLGMSVNF